MEDASKEFQIFMSPSRDYQQPYREMMTSKHRIVPVINKILSSSSSSTFTLNQRKCSVYKAVSGVSFQDTDVVEKKPVARKRDKKKEKERRQSYAAPIPISDSEKKHQILPPAPGTRRSRSLTSMESAMTISTDVKKNLPEITHPFTPVIIYNQSSGRKSRYSRIKDRKRSSSQVRSGVESKKIDSHSPKIEPPIRPRRARSASRSRRPLSLISFPSEDSLEFPPIKDLLQFPQPNNISQKTNSNPHPYHEIISSNSSHLCDAPEDIDFSVNDSDWRKYDAMVTQKLDSLLKKKEEPEGGYFSLEREESEELEHFVEGGDHFQRDNSSETIYVAQAFSKENKVCDIPAKYAQYTVEEIYSEVPFSGQGQEVGFVDDEGLYEEIFFNKNSEQAPTIFNNINYGETSTINILVSPDLQSSQSMPKSVAVNKIPKIEKSSSSTIVYIGGEDSNSQNSGFEDLRFPRYPLKQSTSCSNLLHFTNNSDIKKIKDKKLSVVDIVSKPDSSEDKYQVNNSVWCGCYTRPNFQSNHSSSCIRSRPGILSSKYSQFGDTQEEEKNNSYKVKITSEMLAPLKVNDNSTSVSLQESDSCKPSSDNAIPEPDYELSDIDLDMFAPKPSDSSLHKLHGNHMIRSSSEVHLNLQSFTPLSFSTFSKSKSVKENLPDAVNITSPKTFRGFLDDAIFNPPDTDSATDENEDLVIEEDQIVTCITDTDSSSSSSSSFDSEDDITTKTSPWLEAKNEFEFLTFKEDKKKPLRFFRRKKAKKDASNNKIFGSTFLPESLSSSNRHKEFFSKTNSPEWNPTPKRPNRRRRKTSDTNKLGEIN